MQKFLWCSYIVLVVLTAVGTTNGFNTAFAAQEMVCLGELEKSTSPRASAIIACLKQIHLATPSSEVPAGTIVAWAGKGIVPNGWAVCNGDGGTPDLRGMFLKGVGTLKETGKDPNGSNTHSHTAIANPTEMGHPQGYTAGTSKGNDDSVWTRQLHNHPVAVSSAGNLPPNFRVVYIMKLGIAR